MFLSLLPADDWGQILEIISLVPEVHIAETDRMHHGIDNNTAQLYANCVSGTVANWRLSQLRSSQPGPELEYILELDIINHPISIHEFNICVLWDILQACIFQGKAGPPGLGTESGSRQMKEATFAIRLTFYLCQAYNSWRSNF